MNIQRALYWAWLIAVGPLLIFWFMSKAILERNTIQIIVGITALICFAGAAIQMSRNHNRKPLK